MPANKDFAGRWHRIRLSQSFASLSCLNAMSGSEHE